MKHHSSRCSASWIDRIDLACLILSYLIIAQIVAGGIAFCLKVDPRSKVEGSIASFNQVVYLLQGSGGDLSDALTPEQVVARYQAAEGDTCALTIHSILTTTVGPAEILMPGTTAASKASQSFWQTESSAMPRLNAANA